MHGRQGEAGGLQADGVHQPLTVPTCQACSCRQNPLLLCQLSVIQPCICYAFPQTDHVALDAHAVMIITQLVAQTTARCGIQQVSSAMAFDIWTGNETPRPASQVFDWTLWPTT